MRHTLIIPAFLLLVAQCTAATVVGTLDGQDGWSGGGPGDSSGFTNNGAQPDSSNFDLEHTPGEWFGEAVTTADAHTGTQSWLLRNGYDSSGSGTPFSPGLSVNAGQPSSGAGGDTFFGSFWFKSADSSGDGSRIMIAGGTPAGTDISSNYLEIENLQDGSGVTVRTYFGGWIDVATGLDSDSWHQITMTGRFYDGLSNDTWSYKVNNELPFDSGAYYETYREDNFFGYEMTNRLKFRPRHANHDATKSGFYFDDLLTEVSDFNSGVVLDSYSTGFEAEVSPVPEPSSLTLLGMGLFGLTGYSWRRRKQPVA
ncbi:MAG: hypothetical protein COA78_35295 [Blastopirellula sp.]|nr:MAG: hypothetical protein COA78_35295 [Blastopirellula sp.]